MPDPQPAKTGGESVTTVIIAFLANLAVAAAKSVAALITGSASMVAEAAHSWADTGNEVFLLIAERRSRKPRDAAHPFGYGREAYVWSMFAAFGVFSVGAVVSIVHGISQWGVEDPDPNYLLGYIVLGISAILEGASFTRALIQARRAGRRQQRSAWDYIDRTSDPTLRGVFAEDAAALVGLVIAALGLALHEITGNAVYDAAGSILVGILLAVVAVFLIQRNREFLVGQVVGGRTRDAALTGLLEIPGIESVSFLFLEYVGADRLLLVASVDLEGDPDETALAQRHQEIEDELERHPHIERALLTPSAPGAVPLIPGQTAIRG